MPLADMSNVHSHMMPCWQCAPQERIYHLKMNGIILMETRVENITSCLPAHMQPSGVRVMMSVASYQSMCNNRSVGPFPVGPGVAFAPSTTLISPFPSGS